MTGQPACGDPGRLGWVTPSLSIQRWAELAGWLQVQLSYKSTPKLTPVQHFIRAPPRLCWLCLKASPDLFLSREPQRSAESTGGKDSFPNLNQAPYELVGALALHIHCL